MMNSIRELVNSFGVIGDTQEVAALATQLLSPYLDSVECDRFGNIIGRRDCGAEGALTLMLEANIVQQSFLVTEIAENGSLYFLDLGHSQWPMMGHIVNVKTRSGMCISGVVLAPPSIKDRTVAPSELVIDTGLTAEQVRACVNIGDSVVFAEESFALKEGVLCGNALHARAGLAAIVCALEQLKDKKLSFNLVVAMSVSDDGASDLAWKELPRYSVCLDTCCVHTDDEEMQDVVSGKGAIIAIGPNSSPAMAKNMVSAAEKNGISCQLVAKGERCGTDAWKIRTCGHGIETLTVYLPIEYMYTPVEKLHMDDVTSAGDLLAAFIADFGGGDKE